MEISELLEVYPHLTREDILAPLAYCAVVISNEDIFEDHNY
ncbi:MAG: DUF433 domain-containing protein [candidate division Zixibacteria bacterium]|nr:DUF433 domain-containing protein [Candidatus Tariuqbacter arcticus]